MRRSPVSTLERYFCFTPSAAAAASWLSPASLLASLSRKRFRFTLVAATVSGGLFEATVSFDGREVSRVDWSRGGSACTVLCGLAADVAGIAPGNHTIRFTVVRQTRPTMEYFVNYGGILRDPATGQQEPVNSPQQRIRLQAGQSASFTLRV